MGDYRTTTGEAPPVPVVERRRRRRRGLVLLGLALVALVAAGHFIRVPRVIRAAGYLTTEDYAEVRAPVDGVIAEIHVPAGDRVAAGALLIRLDDREQAALLEEARSRYRQLEADTARRTAEIADRRRARIHEVETSRLRLRSVESRLDRQRELRDRGLAAAAGVEELTLQRELAEAELRNLLDRDPSLFDREADALHHALEAARESVARAEAQWLRRRITAPIAGVVVRYGFAVGEPVRPDLVLYEIFGGAPRVLTVRVDERHALRVTPGQPYSARLTPHGGWGAVRFDGVVESLRDVIQTDGPRTYRTVYCAFDPGGTAVPAGTTADVRIHAGKIRLWTWLLGLD